MADIIVSVKLSEVLPNAQFGLLLLEPLLTISQVIVCGLYWLLAIVLAASSKTEGYLESGLSSPTDLKCI